MTGIYGILCTETNKWYVGASKDIDSRLKAHRSELKISSWTCKKGMHQDVKRFGMKSIKFYVLEECLPCELVEREGFWMFKLNSIRNGYNTMTSGSNRYWRQNGSI